MRLVAPACSVTSLVDDTPSLVENNGVVHSEPLFHGTIAGNQLKCKLFFFYS